MCPRIENTNFAQWPLRLLQPETFPPYYHCYTDRQDALRQKHLHLYLLFDVITVYVAWPVGVANRKKCFIRIFIVQHNQEGPFCA